jgi:hypothetical protein
MRSPDCLTSQCRGLAMPNPYSIDYFENILIGYL